MWVYARMSVHVGVCMHVRACGCMHTSVHVGLCMHGRACGCMHTSVHVGLCTHARACGCMHACPCMWVYALGLERIHQVMNTKIPGSISLI